MATFTTALVFLFSAIFYLGEAKSHRNFGFSLDIVHRSSPLSPLFNASESAVERLRKDILRSKHRFHHHQNSISASSSTPSPSSSPSGNNPESVVIPDGGDYLMNISIGTPPFQIFAVADTGSDLIWTQCEPCSESGSCFAQDAPLFDPKNSTTYRELSCSSPSCQTGGGIPCNNNPSVSSPQQQKDEDSCQYAVGYGDGSQSQGVVALESITLSSTSGRPVKVKGTFGCGLNSSGLFDRNTSGIVGLGGGSQSLISQLDSLIKGVFSYCLVQRFSTPNAFSKLNLGTNGEVSGTGVVSTPLISRSPPDNFYYLTLQGISVDGERFDVSNDASSSSEKGNIIIDSGTTLTLLPSDLYQSFSSALQQKINLTPVEDPTHQDNLCFQSDSSTKIQIPSIIFHFDGADLVLQSYNVFIPMDDNVACLAFSPVSDSQSSQGTLPAIYGNIAQMNFLVGYDLQNRVLSFKPTNCAKL